MSIATEILALRRDRMSSVAALLAAMDWRNVAQQHEVFLKRDYAVLSAADIVLLNVAVHALESKWEPEEATQTSPITDTATAQVQATLHASSPAPSRKRWRWPRFFGGTHVARIHAS